MPAEQLQPQITKHSTHWWAGCRVQFRGWELDVCGSSVTIPPQTIHPSMTLHDLAICLDVARQQAGADAGHETRRSWLSEATTTIDIPPRP